MDTAIGLRCFAFVLCLQIFGGAAFATPLEPLSEAEKAARRAELQHTPWNGQATEKSTSSNLNCRFSTVDLSVHDPVSNQDTNLRLYVSQPHGKRQVPAVIVIPTIEGHTLLETRVAKSLCNNQLAGIIADVNVNEVPAIMPGWNLEDENHQRAVHALRTVVDWAQSYPRFRSDKIGVMGLSLGAITTSLLAGVEDRLKAIVIAAGGGNMPAIQTYSHVGRVVDLRQRRMEYLGITDIQEYERVLRTHLRYDPLHLASSVPRDRVLMMMVEGDTSVPEENQRELWNELGQPEAMWFSSGHVGSLIRLAYLYMGEVASFFHEKFGTIAPQFIEQRFSATSD